MSVELYGKCRELGYCDCGGFFNCQDDGTVGEAKLTQEDIPRQDGRGRRHGSSPYALCPKCKRGLYTNRAHKCEAVTIRLLKCDTCGEEYAGKPSDHMTEAHGFVPEDDTAFAESNQFLFDKKEEEESTMSPLVGDYKPEKRKAPPESSFKKCYLCGKRQYKSHKCKYALPATDGPPPGYEEGATAVGYEEERIESEPVELERSPIEGLDAIGQSQLSEHKDPEQVVVDAPAEPKFRIEPRDEPGDEEVPWDDSDYKYNPVDDYGTVELPQGKSVSLTLTLGEISIKIEVKQ